MSSSPTPFQIDIPEERLRRLKQKLELTDFPQQVSDEETWLRGPPLAEIQRLAQYWADRFDWRRVEAKLNKVPQFTMDVEVPGFGELNMHFIHQKSACPNAIPLLFMHGWPGNFTEVCEILPLLIQGGDDFPAFHVVSPSLINFGFSDSAGKRSFTEKHHGDACHDLMRRLGYSKYVIQAGDLGAFAARCMVQDYAESIGGHLLTATDPREPTETEDPELFAKIKAGELTQEEESGVKRHANTMTEEFGYYAIQSTKPLAIGYSVADSPVGLLAWIYDKMHDWSDDFHWSDDTILTWVSIYWFSKAGPAASQLIYYDATHGDMHRGRGYSEVPLGISRFPKELGSRPKLWQRTMGPLVYWREHDSGGHFAANERPNELVADLRTMFGKGGSAYNRVPNHSGYY